MKAVILAGGEGTRLRPLTLTLPKPVVPVVDRPFLRHQLDLLRRAAIEDVIFSVAYRPERVQAVFGDGRAHGARIRYVVEETPLGTGGAVKNAEAHLDDTTVVFNGDVLSDVDLPGVIARHRAAGADVTIVLTPVENPSAYGLVETDAGGRVRRFLEKPKPEEVTTNTINAGIYVLETRTLELMPPGVAYSIERGFFPAAVASGLVVRGEVHPGYWIDIGTPEKYLQVHRDILDGRFRVALEAERARGGWIHPSAQVAESARLEGPFFAGPGSRVADGAHLGAGAALIANVQVAPGASITASVLWDGTRVAASATVDGALLGPRVRVGAHARVGPGAVLGEDSVVSDHSRTA